MKRRKDGYTRLTIVLVILMLLGAVLPAAVAESNIKEDVKGFDKGVSWQPVVPLKKVTFINFDENSYLDDYAYLAAVPTTVFYDKTSGRLFSYPLLYYQDPYPVEEDKERSLNARQGIDYFMEDWMSYCNGKLDSMTLINVDKNKVEQWAAREAVEIEGDDPYTIAAEIALNDWSYSDEAVIAVIKEKNEESQKKNISGSIEGSLSASEIKEESFVFPQVNRITPQFKDFTIPRGYKYLKARLWYPCFYTSIPGFFNTTLPPGDPNLELFCEHERGWMQVAATFGWNQYAGMDIEKTESYIYKAGKWLVGVTDVPTHSGDEDKRMSESVHRRIGPLRCGRYGSLAEALRNIKDVKYTVDISMYPGVMLPIPEKPCFGARNITFKLTWNKPNVTLGFSLIAPSGEEVLSAADVGSSQEMHLDQLGECLEKERYSICVFAMNEVESPVEFEIKYSWEQGIMEQESHSLTSATEGAVLASVLNTPLLYISPSSFHRETEKTLYKLGVERVHIVDIGEELETDVFDKIRRAIRVEKHFTTLKDIYSEIRTITLRHDVVFSTIDPWTYYYVEPATPQGEKPGALFIGPAAYLAAHHGVPVLIVDNHPRLSSAVVWHNEFWKRHPDGFTLPSVAEMFLTGKRVYGFLMDHGFDREGMETIITVADQYDIGTPWDRVFVGKAKSGRFFGSPVDTAYWISRSVFYPALIYTTPALDPGGVRMLNGSASKRRFPWWGRLGLNIYQREQENIYNYPVLQTYLCYNHRFNERASKYWGWKYKCADGIIPGESPSFEPIDESVCLKYADLKGAYFPDFTSSEIIPLYLNRGGYSNVYSSNFEAATRNLNQGVIMWIICSHGLPANGAGSIEFWNPDSKLVHEPNPWRGYEWYLGSTEEPDTLTMETHGIIPMLFGNPTGKGLTGRGVFKTALDYGLAKKPVLDLMGRLPVIKHMLPKWLQDSSDYYDGVINSVIFNRPTMWKPTGYDMDNALGNIHLAGIISNSCLIANKYIHLTFVRHGSAFQVIDPWATSWYTVWQQFIPRNIAIGYTIGEAFVDGLKHVGILYITDPPQWWADIKQNVCFFGDPDLRPFVPGTKYSDKNCWEREDVEPMKYVSGFSVDGHMPYGATEYPHAYQPLPITLIILAITIISILIVVGVTVVSIRGKKR